MDTIQLLTAFILSIFIVFRIRLPPSVVKYMSTLFGKVVAILLVLYLFYENFILGILGMITIYEMLKQTVSQPGRVSIISEAVLPIDDYSSNQFPPTLEESIVKSIVPLVHNDSPPHLNFKYSEENIHDAAMI
jgi:hypothetical protein